MGSGLCMEIKHFVSGSPIRLESCVKGRGEVAWSHGQVRVSHSTFSSQKVCFIYTVAVLHCICYICTVLYVLNMLIHLDIFSCPILCWFDLRFVPCRCWHLVGGRIFGSVIPCIRGRSALTPSLTTARSLCTTVMAWRGTSCGATGRYGGGKWRNEWSGVFTASFQLTKCVVVLALVNIPSFR